MPKFVIELGRVVTTTGLATVEADTIEDARAKVLADPSVHVTWKLPDSAYESDVEVIDSWPTT